MVIKVCVGSSCHLKGSYDVIEQMKSILKRYDVEDLIDLQAGFCLGNCDKGVTLKVEDVAPSPSLQLLEDGSYFLHNINKDNIETIFAKEVYPLLNL